jgi:PAS domain-containing protein
MGTDLASSTAAAAGEWQIQFANGRAGEVLGIADLDDIVDKSFWDVFTLRNASREALLERLALQLLDGSDFCVEAKAISDEGRKVWVTCSFRSGTMSQVRLGLLHSAGAAATCHWSSSSSACKCSPCVVHSRTALKAPGSWRLGYRLRRLS